jgi:hypothetical protein
MSSSENLSVSLASGVIAGVAAAIISHPADTLLSKINKAGAGGSGGMLSRLGNIAAETGMWKLCTQGTSVWAFPNPAHGSSATRVTSALIRTQLSDCLLVHAVRKTDPSRFQKRPRRAVRDDRHPHRRAVWVVRHRDASHRCHEVPLPRPRGGTLIRWCGVSCHGMMDCVVS